MRRFHHAVPRRHAPAVAASLACLMQAAWATGDPPVASPLGGGESVALEPAPPLASPRRPRPVFVCEERGTPVYADRPCGTAYTVRSLAVDPPRPGAAASTLPPAPRAATRPRTVSGEPRTPSAPPVGDRCLQLQQRLDALDDRMRAGYSAREAARLWQQWREAKQRLRAARC